MRALGPSLGARGVLSPLLDPSLQLFDSSGRLVASNNDWMSDINAQQLIDSGFAPGDSREAALFLSLSPGAYTVVVTGVDGTQNIALVEVYDLDSLSTPQLLNISTRGLVDLGEGVMIAGTIIGGTTGQAVIVRGLGPSLASQGVADFLPNPTLSIVNSLGVVVAANDDWQNDPAAADIQAAGLAPTNTLEAATFVGLVPGSYTAILSDLSGNTGVGLVEIYNITNQ